MMINNGLNHGHSKKTIGMYSHGKLTTIITRNIGSLQLWWHISYIIIYPQLVHWLGLDRRLSCNQAAQTKLSLGRQWTQHTTGPAMLKPRSQHNTQPTQPRYQCLARDLSRLHLHLDCLAFIDFIAIDRHQVLIWWLQANRTNTSNGFKWHHFKAAANWS